MPGNPVKIGPFLGGLNNMSTAGEAKDNELTELVNMEVAKDQSLTMRPPIVAIMDTVRRSNLPEVNWEILGVYRVSETEWYVICLEPAASTYTLNAYLRADFVNAASKILIKATIAPANKPTGMAQFKNDLYFLVGPGATINCFKWAINGTATDITAMKKGTLLMSWKSRLWVTGTLNNTNGDRVWFSKVGSEGPEPGVWETNDYFDVAPGEGGYITAIMPSFNNLIVFKNDGTWRFSYPSSPKQGTIDKISGQVGAAGANAVCEFENFIYVYDQGYVYELVNSNYAQLNTFVRFEEDPYSVDGATPGIDLSIVNRRLVVRYFNAIYVFTIDTKSWSMWRTVNGTPGKWQELPVDSNRAVGSTYLAPSRGVTQAPSGNLISDSRMARQVITNDTSSTIDVWFDDGDDENYIPVGHSMSMKGKANVISYSGGVGMRVRLRRSDGTVSPSGDTAFRIEASGLVEHSFRYSNSIAMQFGIYVTPGASIELENIEFVRESPYNSASSIMKIEGDGHLPIPYWVEMIEAHILTKTYDYQAAAAFKRMFYWGVDMVSPRPIYAEARPVGKKNSLTWGDLEAFTHEELEQGTWENPLSWRTRSTAEISMTDENIDVSENGRFYVKLRKNLRFRQIAFYLKTKSWGNLDTGPSKIFAITTLVSPKKDTIDTVT